MIRPAHLKDLHSNEIVPVSIVSNKKTLLCMNSNGEPIYFQSDKYGFDNRILNEKALDHNKLHRYAEKINVDTSDCIKKYLFLDRISYWI